MMFVGVFDKPFEVIIMSKDGSPIHCTQQSSSLEMRINVTSKVNVLVKPSCPPQTTSVNDFCVKMAGFPNGNESATTVQPSASLSSDVHGSQAESSDSGILFGSIPNDSCPEKMTVRDTESPESAPVSETEGMNVCHEDAQLCPINIDSLISESFVVLDDEITSSDYSMEQKIDEKRRPNAFKNGVKRFKKIGLSSIFKSFTSNFRHQPGALSKDSGSDQSDAESCPTSDEEKLEVPPNGNKERLTKTTEDSVDQQPDVPVIGETEGQEEDKLNNVSVEDTNDQSIENANEVVTVQPSNSVQLVMNQACDYSKVKPTTCKDSDQNFANKRKISLVDIVSDESKPCPASVTSSAGSSEPQSSKKLKKSDAGADKRRLSEEVQSDQSESGDSKQSTHEEVEPVSEYRLSEPSRVEITEGDQSSSDKDLPTDESSQSPMNMNDSEEDFRDMESYGLSSVCKGDGERGRTSESGCSTSSCENDNLTKKRRGINGFNVAGLPKRAAFTVVAIEKGWKQDGDRSHAIFQNIYKDFGKHQDKILEILIEKNCIKVYTVNSDTRSLLIQELKEINLIINETSPFQLDIQNPLKPSIQFLVQDNIYNLSCSEFLTQLKKWNDWDDGWTVHVESKEWIRKIRKGKISLIVDARIRDKLETEDLIIAIDQIPVKVFDKFGITQCSVCLRFGHAKCRSRIRCFFCSCCHPDKIRHDKYSEQRFCFLCRASGHTPIAKNCPSLIGEIQSKLELIDYEYSDIYLGNDRSY